MRLLKKANTACNTTGPYLAITAIAEARKAVTAIHRYVMNKNRPNEESNDVPSEKEEKAQVILTTS